VSQAAAWFARLRSERTSPEERQAFEEWRRQSPSHARAYDEVCGLWNDPSLKAAAIQTSQAGRTAPFRKRAKWLLQAAAVAALVSAVGLQLELTTRLKADHRTVTGERLVVNLPDQSTVTLNTHSAIATEFDGTERRIHLLKGEALFQVEPDNKKPFVVDNQAILARAVGTQFLVREEPNGIRLTVVEGLVELTPDRPGWAPVRVTPGQQVAVDGNGPGPLHDIDAQAATAWVRGRLVFDNAPLGEVVEELRRYYPGVILLWNSKISSLRVSGSYTLTDPAAVLNTLAQTLPLRIARITDHIVVLR